MKRATGAVLAGLATVLLALPPWFGSMTEEAFRAQAEEAAFGDYLEVRVADYERGWFGSSATLELGVTEGYADLLRSAVAGADGGGAAGPGGGGEWGILSGDPALRLAADIAHGPVGVRRGPFVGLARGVMRPELPDGALEAWRQELGVPYLFEVRQRIGFRGGSRFEVVVPAIDLQRDGSRVALAGTGGWVEFDPGSRRIAGEAGVETLAVADDESDLRVESASAEAEGTLLEAGVLLGSGELRVDRLSLVRPYETPARTDLVGFEATGSTELSGDGSALNSSFTYAVDALVAGDTLREAEVRMSTLNVDREAAEAYVELTRRAALAGEETDGEATGEELSGLIHDFLVAGPVFEVDPLRFRYGGEPFLARVRVTTDPSVLPDREDFELLDSGGLEMWRRLFDAEAEVEVSAGLARSWAADRSESAIRARLLQSRRRLPDEEVRAMAERQADVLLTGMVEGGLLDEDGDGYVSRLGFQDGRLTANGEAVPLPGGALTP